MNKKKEKIIGRELVPIYTTGIRTPIAFEDKITGEFIIMDKEGIKKAAKTIKMIRRIFRR